MNRSLILAIGLLLVFFLTLLPPVPAASQDIEKSPKDLPPQYRRWLEEEVVYIITSKERDVFLHLGRDRERDVFINMFWKQRDPTPDTEKNEFREEHSRRLAYANQWFGRGYPGPGWRSDMGRIYIILGEPKTRDRFENLAQVFPVEIWFYEGLGSLGLPGSFNVVFFKEEGTGSYILYHPMRDGPQKLLNNYEGDMTDYGDAYLDMMDIEPSIAHVSLSLIPGEFLLSPRPTLSSEFLLESRIPSAAFAKVNADYADKLLRYKDIIEVDYSTKYIDSDALIRVYQEPGGVPFVHFSIEPSRLTFEPAGELFHAHLEMNVSVTDPQGGLVYQFDRSVPFDMTEAQLAAIRDKLFSFQDLFPLVPGSYKISILLKNNVSQEFTSAEASLVIPAAEAFTLFAPAIAYRVDSASKFRGQTKPFVFGDRQLTPSPRNDFLIGETLHVFFQLRNAPEDVQSGGLVTYTILKDTEKGPETVRTVTKALAEYPDRTNIFEQLSLTDLTPAYYTLRISILSAARVSRIAADDHFLITAVPSLKRPWVLSVPLPPPNAPQFSHILGLQYLNKKDFAASRPLLEAAVRNDPASAVFALDYARLLFELKEYAGVKRAAGAFLADERKWDFLEIVGRACQALGENAEAIAYYKEYLDHFGTNLNVLNAVGECYSLMGNTADALAAWENSLRLEPNQPKIKERVEELRKKK